MAIIRAESSFTGLARAGKPSPAGLPYRPSTPAAPYKVKPPAKPKSPSKPKAPASDPHSSEEKLKTMKRLGLIDPREALLCLPGLFADTRVIQTAIPDEDDEDPRLYNLQYTGERCGYDKEKKLLDLNTTSGWSKVFRLSMVLIDENGATIEWSVFGNAWPYRDLENGQYIPLVGRVQQFGEKLILMDVATPPAHAIGKIWVKYQGIPGRVASEKVEIQVRSQLDNEDAYKYCATKLIGCLGMHDTEALDAAGAADYFSTFEALLKALHQPCDVEQGWMAKITANKLAAMAVQASAMRHNIRHSHPDAPISVTRDDIERMILTQKEKLTDGQFKVAHDVGAMLRSPRPMNALLSGDVGTGKTIPFLITAVAAHLAGAKVTIIAPTSILADQIAKELVARFGDHIRGAERIAAGGKIFDHGNILIGTPGITSVCAKAKYTPNYLICDEQHKLSTAIREVLIKPWTHTLEVSATLIPRSLASALFGGKAVLNLSECPVKKTFNCVVGDLTQRPLFGQKIKEAIDKGERAAVIYPRVNVMATESVSSEGEVTKREMQSVLSGAAALERVFPGKVVAIHGGMEEGEIKVAIEAVRNGTKPLVVASTVIETGVDIPGITCMIVRDADYFGISQLHQLRGRLVRRGGVGEFMMMVNSMADLSEDTYARLDAIRTTTDGYALSEIDLIQRGFGTLEGEVQSGSGSSETVFRLVKLRPDDFLRKKLSKDSLRDRSLDLSTQRAKEAEERNEMNQLRTQPRLFG